MRHTFSFMILIGLAAITPIVVVVTLLMAWNEAKNHPVVALQEQKF